MVGSIFRSRIVAFTLGMAVTSLFALFAWLSFRLLTMMMNPDLVGTDYWATVGDRAGTNPGLAMFLGFCCLGVVGGVILMVKAVVVRPQKHNEPVTAADRGSKWASWNW